MQTYWHGTYEGQLPSPYKVKNIISDRRTGAKKLARICGNTLNTKYSLVSLTTQCLATPAIVLIMGLFIYIWWLCEGYCYTNLLIMYSSRKQNVTESDKILASKQTPILLTTPGPMKCRKLCMIKKWMPRRQRLSWLMNSRWAMEHNLGADAYLISRSYFY